MKARNWTNKDRVLKALDERRAVKITYKRVSDGGVTTRVIEPLMVYDCDFGHPSLLAYCRLRGEYRTFLLGSIKNSLLKYETFSTKKHVRTILNKLSLVVGGKDITNFEEMSASMFNRNISLVRS
jgi:predicted DNA-binding transcriptional regulator YafY